MCIKIRIYVKPGFHSFWQNLLLVDTCHVVETVHLYSYWLLVCFPPAVSKCDRSQKESRMLVRLSSETCFAFPRFL